MAVTQSTVTPSKWTITQPYGGTGGWTRVQFREKPWELEQIIQDLCLIPGIVWRDRDNYLELPRWAYSLVPVRAFFEDALGETTPTPKFWKPDGFGWVPKRRPYDFQYETAKFALDNHGGLIGNDMGTGKTLTAILAAETYARQRNNARPRLIIAPNMVREDWRKELLAMGVIEKPEDLVVLSGRDFVKKQGNWEDPRTTDKRWYFIHYDILAPWAGKLHQGNFITAIIDEIHYAKNPGAARAKGLFAVVGSIPFRVGLTGTPITNRPSDLWVPLTAVCGPYTWGSNASFRIRYSGALSSGYGLTDTTPTNVAELQDRLRTVFIQKTLKDTGLSLPPLTRNQLACDIHVQLMKEHDRALKKLPLDKISQALITGRFYSDNVLPILTQARQVTARAKIATTTEAVANVVDQGVSAVVFTYERDVAEQLAGALGKQGYEAQYLHGGQDIAARSGLIDWFQDRAVSDYPRVLCATYGSLGVGVTLTAARSVFLHDLPWTMADVLQAEKRVHRIGSTAPVVSSWVIAHDTIDEWIARILGAKAYLSKEILKQAEGVNALDEVGLRDPDDFAASKDIQKALDAWLLSHRSR